MKTYWKKIYRDTVENRLQSSLVLVAIIIGIIGTGSVVTTYAVLNYEIDANFANSNPPDAIFHSSNITSDMISQLQSDGIVKSLELRVTIHARLKIDDHWEPMLITAKDDLSHQKIATSILEEGQWPSDGAVVIERSSEQIQHTSIGSNITIKAPDGKLTSILVTGRVKDGGVAPGWQDGITYAYTSLQTLRYLGENISFSEILLKFTFQSKDASEIATQAYNLRDRYDMADKVTTVIIPEPGVHPHTDQMNSLLFLIQVFGVITQILSGILVYFSIGALMERQTKEIGIFKSIGGQSKDIRQIYRSYILLLGSLSLIIAIPIGNQMGKMFAGLIAGMLNFDITKGIVPWWVYLTEIIIGFFIPFIASVIPIRRLSAKSANEILTSFKSYNPNSNTPKKVIPKIPLFKYSQLLSLRNTFRRRFRLVLILFILSVGGATFISAINIGNSWRTSIDQGYSSRLYDIKLDFATPYSTTSVADFMKSIPEIQQFEAWDQVAASYSVPYKDDGLIFRLTGLPPTTQLVDYPLVKGRWFNSNDTNAIVINHELYYDEHTDINVGDQLNLNINGKDTSWVVIGVILQIGSPRRGFSTPASAFVNKDYLSQYIDTKGMTTSLRIKVNDKLVDNLIQFTNNLENKLYQANFHIKDIQASETRLQILRDHIVVIISFLLMMAGLIVVVGILSLTSITSISIIERYRELGVMKAIGAKGSQIRNIITTEALVVGILSFVLSILLSFPITILAGNYAGWVFIRADLVFDIKTYPMVIWFVLVLVISYIAAYIPGRSLSKGTTAASLQYE